MDLKVAKRFMDELLVSLYKKGGSDLFIIAGAAPSMRIHGKVTPVMDKKLTAEHTLALAQCLMTEEERSDFKANKECNFAIALPSVSRFRVNALVQRGSAGLNLYTTIKVASSPSVKSEQTLSLSKWL